MTPIPPGESQVEAVPQVGCTVKLNIVLKELPSFTARPGTDMPHHLGQVNTPLSKEEWRTNVDDRTRGRTARTALDRALFSYRPRSRASHRRACTR